MDIVLYPRRSLADRVLDSIVIPFPGGCWLWTAPLRNDGYGEIGSGGREGKQILAHRASYLSFVGPIPDGLELDHLCRVRCCVNPAHLEPVTRAENNRRGLNGVLKTHCKRGHLFVPENRVSNGPRATRCLPCLQEKYAEQRLARRG